ncbi:MAG: hypothetical protein C5B43_03060 [Verrucomicrobia bacterium]|nr:MAG: hypothetical protein C5B43_03060 [Verrucomicrobiota bacterium]
MKPFYQVDRIINLEKVYKFFIEQCNGKFRIYCEMEDRVSGRFLFEFDTLSEAQHQLYKIYLEILNK